MSTSSVGGVVGFWPKRKSAPVDVERMHVPPTETADVTLTTAIEVASVKAQAQSMARRLKAALDDIYGDVEELEHIVDKLPEEDGDDVRGAGPPAVT
jgi:hypothetical protein